LLKLNLFYIRGKILSNYNSAHSYNLIDTIQHRTVPIIFLLIIRTNVIAQTLSTGWEEKELGRLYR